jgi:hypothetical protein
MSNMNEAGVGIHTYELGDCSSAADYTGLRGAATEPLHQAVEFSVLAMFRSRPICGCVESFLL